jgi:hypothetical protein
MLKAVRKKHGFYVKTPAFIKALKTLVKEEAKPKESEATK